MTKNEFRKRWNSNDEGGGITYDDIAECAVKWGLYQTPKIHPMNQVKDKVLIAAGCKKPSKKDLIHIKKKDMAEKTESLVEIKDNKCWVTISYNVNLGDYENVKVETGYSQTIPFNRSPIDLLEEMQDNVSSLVIDEAKSLKRLLKRKRK